MWYKNKLNILLLFLFIFSQCISCISAVFTPINTMSFGIHVTSTDFYTVETLSFGVKTVVQTYNWSIWSAWWTMTYPFGKPSNFVATRLNTSSIHLSWIKSANSSTTYILYNKTKEPEWGDGYLAYNGTGNNITLNGLSTGTIYYFKAWSYNILYGFSNDNASAYCYTQVGTPSNIGSPTNTSTTISLIWTKGINSTATVICYSSLWFPVYPLFGTVTTSDNIVITNLSSLTKYYFSLWGRILIGYDYLFNPIYNYSSPVLFATNTSFTPTSPTNFHAVDYNDSIMYLTWNKGSGLGSATVYTIVRSKLTGYPTNPTDGTLVYSGVGNSKTDIGLTTSTKYYYRAWAYSGTVYSDHNASSSNYTRPMVPYNGSSVFNGSVFKINLSWYEQNGSTHYVVVRKLTGYPTNPTDGITVQNNTVFYRNYYNETVLAGSIKYFSIFGYNSTTNLYSLEHLDIPWGALTIYGVYNESKPSQRIGYDLEITNHNATITYTKTNQNNPLYIDINDIPYGLGTYFLISNSSYRPRSFTEDIVVNNFYNFSRIYLPPIELPIEGGGTEGENYSRMYRLHVIDHYQSPLSDVHVIIKRYINTTDSYETISTFNTNGYGDGDLWLLPSNHYKVFLSKDGYSDVIGADWLTDPTFYGANYPFVIGMELAPTVPSMWDYISFTVEPHIYDRYENFTVYFNITTTIDLEYFMENVYQYDETTGNWYIIYSENNTVDVNGGSLNYTVTSFGRYGFEFGFKLIGYDEYIFGYPHSDSKIVFIYWNSTAAHDLDTIIRNVAGDNPIFVGAVVASYIALFTSAVITFVLFTFSPKFSGLGVIAVGIILGFLKNPLGIVSNDIMNWTIVGIICILGFIMLLYYRKNPSG